MRACSMFVLVALLAGCGQPAERKPQTPAAAQPKSSAQDVLDTMSQRSAIEAGRRAQQRIRQISSNENHNLNEAIGQ